MKNRLLLGVALLLAVSASSQTFYPEEPAKIPASRRFYSNTISVRYDVQDAFTNTGRVGAMLQHITIDYSRYNFRNIGWRSGLKVGVTPDASPSLCVPMHFVWRSGRSAARDRRNASNYAQSYYNGQYMPSVSPLYGEPKPADAVTGFLISYLPFVLDLHAGITPGMLGRTDWDRGTDTHGEYRLKHRFICTADLGTRVVIPIWRFGLLFDLTYHYMLTDNFKREEYQKPARFYFNVGFGLQFSF